MNGAIFSLAIYSIPLGYLTPSSSVSGLLSHRLIHWADILEYHLCFTTAFQVEGGKQVLLVIYLVESIDPGQILCGLSAPLT